MLWGALAVILTVLKIIALAVGAVLALIVVLLCAALFCAVYWRAEAEKGEAVAVSYRARWLIVFVRGGFPGETTVRVLGIPLRGRKKKAEKKTAETETAEAAAAQPSEDDTPKKGKPRKPKKEKPKKEREKPNKPLIERLKDVWSAATGYVNDPEYRRLPAYTARLVKQVLRALKPRRLRAEGTLGFDDPAATGMAIGLIGALAGFWRLPIDVEGDFENARLVGRVNARGRLRLIRLVAPVVRFALYKPVRGLLFRRKKG